ncbi:MAG: hypothetical protein WBS54_04390 [Acidobacteriota bacterium]
MRRLSTILMVFGLVLTLSCGKKESKEVSSQMETAQKIAKLEQDVDKKQEQMNQLLQKYVQEGGKDVGTVMGQSLTPEQKALLEQKLQKEQGIGYKDLITDILGRQKEVEDLRVQIQDLEKKLPSAVVVKPGERHYDIAMNFLTKEKGLDPATAKKLVERVNLMDELVPGFKVWNFYDNGVYGTFVTQGDASISPYRVIQRAKQQLVSAKNEAISQRDSLAKDKATLTEQVADLEKKRDQLNQDVAMLQAEREDLLKKMNDLQNLSDDLKARLNSIFYKVGDRQAMVKEGLVQDPWYGQPRLVKFDEANFPDHLDLRSGDTITFTAQQAGVKEIKKIKIAPGVTFKINVDYTYTISPDGLAGEVKILNKDKFKAERTMVILIN